MTDKPATPSPADALVALADEMDRIALNNDPIPHSADYRTACFNFAKRIRLILDRPDGAKLTLSAPAAGSDACRDALSDIVHYSGGAQSALDDPYVMERAREALESPPPAAPEVEGLPDHGVEYATVREAHGEFGPLWHIECRFRDGQKYAAITVDPDREALADWIAHALSGTATLSRRVEVSEGEVEAALCAFWDTAQVRWESGADGMQYAIPHGNFAQAVRAALSTLTRRAAVEGDAKDGERFRILAERFIAADFDYGDEHESVLIFSWPRDTPVAADLRITIDGIRSGS